MQARMKKYPLSEQQVQELLNSEQVGRLATTGSDGYPYIIPVHYTYMGGCIYIHGLGAGEKIDNIRANSKVCFEVDRMQGLLHGDEPCDTNTLYESVIIRGDASLVEAVEKKIAVLDGIITKYTPQHQGKAFPDNMLKMTAIIEIVVSTCTGKYYSAS